MKMIEREKLQVHIPLVLGTLNKYKKEDMRRVNSLLEISLNFPETIVGDLTSYAPLRESKLSLDWFLGSGFRPSMTYGDEILYNPIHPIGNWIVADGKLILENEVRRILVHEYSHIILRKVNPSRPQSWEAYYGTRTLADEIASNIKHEAFCQAVVYRVFNDFEDTMMSRRMSDSIYLKRFREFPQWFRKLFTELMRKNEEEFRHFLKTKNLWYATSEEFKRIRRKAYPEESPQKESEEPIDISIIMTGKPRGIDEYETA